MTALGAGMTETAQKLILIGKVTGAFGVQGEVRITAYTESPLALLNYRDLLREDGAPALTLISGRSFKGGVIARAKEVADKTAADALRGLVLHVPREALPEPEEDEFYLTDLIGLRAETADGTDAGQGPVGAELRRRRPPGDRSRARAAARAGTCRSRCEAVPEVDIAGRASVIADAAQRGVGRRTADDLRRHCVPDHGAGGLSRPARRLADRDRLARAGVVGASDGGHSRFLAR